MNIEAEEPSEAQRAHIDPLSISKPDHNRTPKFRDREKASEIAFAHIIEKINEGFVALDVQMNYTYINQRGSELLKREPEDLIGKNYWEEYPQDKDTSFATAYRQALETQTPIELEDYYAPRDRWFVNRIYPSEHGLSIFFNDITERKRLEDDRSQLLQSERAQRASAEQAQAAAEQELAERNLAERALGTWARHPLPHEARPLWKGYGTAITVTALAIFLRVILQPVLGDFVPLATLFGAVAFSVWYGGVGPALLSVIAGYIGANWFIIEPLYSIGLNGASLIGLGLFILSGLTIISLGEGMRRAQRHAHQSAQVAIARQEQLQLQLVEQKRIENMLRTANEKAEISRDRIARLQQITAALTGSTTKSKLAETVLEQSTQASDAVAGILVEVLGNGQEIKTIAALGYPSAAVRNEPVPLSAPTPMSDCIRTKQAVWIRSQAEFAEQYPSIAEFRRSLGNEATAALPLIVDDNVLGGLAFSFVEVQEFEEDEQSFFLAVAQRCAQALERARAQELLRTEREILERLVETMPVMMSMYYPETNSMRFNAEFERTLGWKVEEVTVLSILEGLYPDPDYRNQVLQRMAAAGRTDWVEVQVQTRDGRTLDSLWANISIMDGEQIIRGIALGLDITERKKAEDALRQSEERFTRFMQHFPGLAWIKDLEGRYVYANAAVETAFNTPLDKLYGSNDHDIFPPETAAQFRANDELARKEEKGVQLIETLQHIDGILHYSLVHKFTIPGPDGQTALIGGTAVDITERMQAEAELKRSMEREQVRANQLEAIMEAVPAAIWVSHDAKARLVTGNRASYEILHLPVGGNASLSSPDDVKPTNFQVWHNGQIMQPDELPVQRAARGEEVYGFEEEVRFEDGTSVYLLGNAITLHDEQNNPSGAVAAFVDITERKHVEEALRESEERFHAILRQATAGIVRKDAVGRLLFVNHAFCNMLGYAESDLLGNTIWQFTHADDVEENKRLYDRTMLEGIPFKLERRLIRADGSILWVDASVSPVMDGKGKPQSAVTVEVDITARKQAEAALQQLNLDLENRVERRTAQLQGANQALDESRKRLQVLSQRLVEVQEEERSTLARELHDSVGQSLAALNLNLTIINNQLANFVNEQVKSRLSDSASLVLDVITLVRDLISNLRPTVLDDFGLEAALQMTVDKFNSRYGIGIRFDTTHPLLPPLESSIEMTLFRIAQEGLLNAARHAQADQVALSLHMHEQAVHMTIQDNGIGILSLPETNRPGSHGMKIMRERAEAVGGNLQILSTPGNGTQIEVSIPIQNNSSSEVHE